MADDGTTIDAGTGSATDADAGKDTTAVTDGKGSAADDGLAEAGRRALAEERKARKAAEAELTKLRAASMSEQEKAVAEAKAAGAADASKATAPRLVKAELRAAAAEAGLPKEALDGFLDYADLNRFLTDDGDVDSKAVAAAVKRLGGGTGRPSYDGGARNTATAPADMSSLIRRAAGIS